MSDPELDKVFLISTPGLAYWGINRRLVNLSREHSNMHVFFVPSDIETGAQMIYYGPEGERHISIDNLGQAQSELRKVLTTLPAYDLFILNHGEVDSNLWGRYSTVFEKQTGKIQQIYTDSCYSGSATRPGNTMNLPVGVPVFTLTSDKSLGFTLTTAAIMGDMRSRGLDWHNLRPYQMFYEVLDHVDPQELAGIQAFRAWVPFSESLPNPISTNPYEVMPSVIGMGHRSTGGYNLATLFHEYRRNDQPFSAGAIEYVREYFVETGEPGDFGPPDPNKGVHRPAAIQDRINHQDFDAAVERLQRYLLPSADDAVPIPVDMLGLAYALTFAEIEPEVLGARAIAVAEEEQREAERLALAALQAATPQPPVDPIDLESIYPGIGGMSAQNSSQTAPWLPPF